MKNCRCCQMWHGTIFYTMTILTPSTFRTFLLKYCQRMNLCICTEKSQADLIEVLSDRNDIKNSLWWFNGLRISEENGKKPFFLSFSDYDRKKSDSFVKMFSIGLLHLVALSVHSQRPLECNFDYRRRCLEGPPSAPFVLLNATSEEPRQPAFDVTAIGKEHFFHILFCYSMIILSRNFEWSKLMLFSFSTKFSWNVSLWKTDPNLASTCPTFNATGSRINCSEGKTCSINEEKRNRLKFDHQKNIDVRNSKWEKSDFVLTDWVCLKVFFRVNIVFDFITVSLTNIPMQVFVLFSKKLSPSLTE